MEEALLTADVGVQTSLALVDTLRTQGAKKSGSELKQFSEQAPLSFEKDKPLQVTGHTPYVIVLIGVNGSGKTITIGKISSSLRTRR